jgi:hypothetical protein
MIGKKSSKRDQLLRVFWNIYSTPFKIPEQGNSCIEHRVLKSYKSIKLRYFVIVITTLFAMLIGIFNSRLSAYEGYMPPGSNACGGLDNTVLIYAGGKGRIKWTVENLLPYAAYVDNYGEIKDSFFDAFLFLELLSKSSGLFYPWPLTWGKLAIKSDWEDILSELFKKGENLDALNKVAESLKTSLKNYSNPKIIIFIPYPDYRQHSFGDINEDGYVENFSQIDDRFKAVQWYVNRVLKTWKERNFANLELAGFYWNSESVSDNRSEKSYFPNDLALVNKVSSYIHLLGYKFYWIPFFNAWGRTAWKDFGIDCAFIQPNYFFKKVEKNRIKMTAEIAKTYNMGFEIEFDGRVINSTEFADRYRAYLDGGVEYGYMKKAIKAYYEGGGGLLQIYKSKDVRIRKLYDEMYRFVKGTYTKEIK